MWERYCRDILQIIMNLMFPARTILITLTGRHSAIKTLTTEIWIRGTGETLQTEDTSRQVSTAEIIQCTAPWWGDQDQHTHTTPDIVIRTTITGLVYPPRKYDNDLLTQSPDNNYVFTDYWDNQRYPRYPGPGESSVGRNIIVYI